jgi:hypothetical protein
LIKGSQIENSDPVGDERVKRSVPPATLEVVVPCKEGSFD